MSDGQIRFVGLSSMIVGLLIPAVDAGMKWVLPEYIEDILPAQAKRIEALRRRILDLFFSKDYELVMPPLLEYVDSLLTGTGHDLELRTFKVVDQLSGRMMGVRADITPQVARIDAHLLNRRGVTPCYCGSVLHTRLAAPGATREPIQIGAEMSASRASPPTWRCSSSFCRALALPACASARRHRPRRHLPRDRARGGVNAEREAELSSRPAAQGGARVEELSKKLRATMREALLVAEPTAGGSARRSAEEASAARRGEAPLRSAGSPKCVSRQLRPRRAARLPLPFAWCSTYCDGVAGAVARGGRYDEVGKAFGRARPATGFSIDLRALASVS